MLVHRLETIFLCTFYIRILLSQKLTDKQSCRNLTRYLGALEATERASMNKISNTGE